MRDLLIWISPRYFRPSLKTYFSSVSHHSILGRIIRVTPEVDDYRQWIQKNWGNSSQNDLSLNSMFLHLNVFNIIFIEVLHTSGLLKLL